MPLDKASAAFAEGAFRRFYTARPPQAPPETTHREFAFTYFGREGMHRPVGFRGGDDLGAFLAREAPSHAYYSSATYTDPLVPMAQKQWLGADLLFDLDADHLPGAKDMTYQEMLAAVKGEFIHLLEEFLLGDLGFDPAHMLLTFSGGRGYHCHYRDPRVRVLRNPERREIVDHLLARTVDRRALFPPGLWDPARTDAASGGWRGRIVRGVLYEIDRFARMPPDGEDAVVAMAAMLGRIEPPPGSQRATARALFKFLFAPGHGADGNTRSIAEKTLASRNLVFLTATARGDRYCELLMDMVVAGAKVGGLNDAHPMDHGETDVTVTGDEKRIIRLPGSLHGKTGFVVTPIVIDGDPVAAVKAFDPFVEAIAPLGGGAVRVAGKRDAALKIAGEDVAVRAGAETELPEAAALFFVLRGDAEAAA